MAFYNKLSAASDAASSTVAKARVGKRISRGLTKYHLHHTGESGVTSGLAAYRDARSEDSAAEGKRRQPLVRGSRATRVQDGRDIYSWLQQVLEGSAYHVERDGDSYWIPLCTTQADGQTYSSGLQLLTKYDGQFLYSARIVVTDSSDDIVAIVSVPSTLFSPQSPASADATVKFLDSYVAAVQGVSLDALEGALSVPALGYWVDVYTFDDEDEDDDADEDDADVNGAAGSDE